MITYIWHEFHIDVCLLFNWGITWTLTNWKKVLVSAPAVYIRHYFWGLLSQKGRHQRNFIALFKFAEGLYSNPRNRINDFGWVTLNLWKEIIEGVIRFFSWCNMKSLCMTAATELAVAAEVLWLCKKKLLLRILCQFYFTIKIGALSFFAILIDLIKPLFFCRRKLFSLRGFAQIWETLKKNGCFIQCDQKSSFLFKFILSHNYLFQSGTIFFG